MKVNIYKFLSGTIKVICTLALILFSSTVYSQATYTFNYTGSTQTVSLPAGNYSISCWGAIGGWHNNDANSYRGKGGYSKGTLSLTATTTLYISVGGSGGAQTSNSVPGGWNGGGPGKYYTYAFNGGGGASHVATLTGVLSALSSNTSAVIIVAGGGAGGCTGITPGDGGALTGGNSTRSGCTGGTQSSAGTSAITGGSASFGQGWDASSSGGSYGGGGGGWYGGGCESGGSGYIGGVANGTTVAFGQTGFVSSPTSTADGLVIINELCSVTLSATGLMANNSLCSGNSVTLTTNAISNYSWSTGATTQSIVVSPSASGIYSVTGTSTAGCNSSASVSITVNGAVPSLSIVNTASATSGICVGKSATLTASGALAYSWAGGATTVTNGVGFFPIATTIYTVTGTNGCGSSTANATITIAPLVVTASTTSSLVCQGSTVVLTAVSAVNGYTWAPQNVATNPLTLAPQANTIYTVTASDGTCIGTATVAVNTNPVPTINVVASNSLVCDGSVVTLTASGASTFTWTGQGSNSAVISVTPVGATNYQVSGSNSFGCSANGGQIILTKAAPVLTVAATKTLVCVGGSVNLTANGASSYAWVNGPLTAGNLVNPAGLTTYSVVGTGTNGCTSAEYMITINTLATNLSVSASTTGICQGLSTTLTASGANTYTWTGIPSSQGVAMVSPATTTVYTVTASTTVTGLSCPSTTNISITVNSNPTITVIATKTVVCRTDANITLTASGGVTYSWSANTNSASTTASNVSVHPTTLNNNIYSVTGMNANGCINSGSVTINVRTCTGIEELKGIGNSVIVYPNPSNGDFNVSTDSEITLKVINELGQEVRTLSLTSENNFKALVTNLAGGVYFLVGQNTNGKINQKVIVTK
ncbi:hypothetical protein CNR22_09895 [Sphingobacteriaceae bacterium]|nr:hypothetical protein CNR22_09895 [Sphingobacteriaceae bacterium]